MRITLLRHAKVQEEYQGRYNGHIDIGLSTEGRAEAKALAEVVNAEQFDKIYCSDLRRARETLKALSLKQEVYYTAALREKSWGRHEGKSFEEIEAEGIKYCNFTQWIEALDGESIESFTENLKIFLTQEIAPQKAKNILIVTHSGVIKTLLSIIKNISLEEAFSTPLAYGETLILDTISL